jgi:hypothetical protein
MGTNDFGTTTMKLPRGNGTLDELSETGLRNPMEHCTLMPIHRVLGCRRTPRSGISPGSGAPIPQAPAPPLLVPVRREAPEAATHLSSSSCSSNSVRCSRFLLYTRRSRMIRKYITFIMPIPSVVSKQSDGTTVGIQPIVSYFGRAATR